MTSKTCARSSRLCLMTQETRKTNVCKGTSKMTFLPPPPPLSPRPLPPMLPKGKCTACSLPSKMKYVRSLGLRGNRRHPNPTRRLSLPAHMHTDPIHIIPTHSITRIASRTLSFLTTTLPVPTRNALIRKSAMVALAHLLLRSPDLSMLKSTMPPTIPRIHSPLRNPQISYSSFLVLNQLTILSCTPEPTVARRFSLSPRGPSFCSTSSGLARSFLQCLFLLLPTPKSTTNRP
jgi:hypothetical protein